MKVERKRVWVGWEKQVLAAQRNNYWEINKAYCNRAGIAWESDGHAF